VINPRVYQKEAIPVAREAIRKEGRALVVMATALGKTITSALIWHGFVSGRGVFFAHSNAILKDAMEGYAEVYGPSVKLSFYNGRSKDIAGADIVFATFQTMTRNLHHFTRSYFAWMTVDETHHAQAATFRKVIEHFRCPRLGITATPDRTDLLDIRELFGEEVISISLEEAIARGWLPRIEYHVVTDDGFDERALQRIVREVMQEGKRLSLAEINRRVFIKARDTKVAETIEKYEVQSLIFCRNIAHIKHFLPFLRSAEAFHSKRTRAQNERALENLRTGATRRVLSVNAFNEGINVPDVGLVVFYRSTESETIFKQQLGRGMRPPKEKLIALDFVGNIERIRMLQALSEDVARLHEKHTSETERKREGYAHDRVHVSGTGFDFTFTDTVVDLMDVVSRVTTQLYPTWQEASEAAKKLNVQSVSQYVSSLKQDPQLPTNPYAYYSDFPGYITFFGKSAPDYYRTWEAASRAAILLKIRSGIEYTKRYKEDQRLPSNPKHVYPDFPGIDLFLGKKVPYRGRAIYSSWQEAGKAAQKLKIKNRREYDLNYKNDPRLPSNPSEVYGDFPGTDVFLGKKTPYRGREIYKKWQVASKSAQALKITSQRDYKRKYKKDSKLPAHPESYYPDFPGYRKFLNL
jgi:superfamily II DNA or RNA helicase